METYLTYNDLHYLHSLVLYAKMYDKRAPKFIKDLNIKIVNMINDQETIQTKLYDMAEEYHKTKSIPLACELAEELFKLSKR